MKKTITLCAILTCMIFTTALGQNTASEDLYPGIKNGNLLITPGEIPKTGTYFTGEKSVILYDNGSIVNFPGSGGNPDTSRLQSTSLGMNTIGAGHQLANFNRVADEFTFSDSAWTIDSVVFLAYQTGSSTTSTINHYNLRVWDGPPGVMGSNIVWGDTTTNRMVRTGWSHIYRNTETAPTDVSRPVMATAVATPGLVLTAGTYWFDWQAGGTLASGPWAPPITIFGMTTTGNARQKASGVWADLLDTGTSTGIGMPFVIYGVVGAVVFHDIGVTALVSPVDGVLTSAETIEVTIENFSSNSETGFSVKYSIDGLTPVAQTFSTTLAGMGSQNFTFTTTADLSVPGMHTIKAWTECMDDMNAVNDTVTETVNNTASINEISNPTLSVYPNPATDLIRVSSNQAIAGIRLIDQLGNTVFSDTPQTTDIYIRTSSLSGGVYFMEVQTGSGISYKKIVVR